MVDTNNEFKELKDVVYFGNNQWQNLSGEVPRLSPISPPMTKRVTPLAQSSKAG
jgi:hypothetical protein